jgi:hypothetical protein
MLRKPFVADAAVASMAVGFMAACTAAVAVGRMAVVDAGRMAVVAVGTAADTTLVAVADIGAAAAGTAVAMDGARQRPAPLWEPQLSAPLPHPVISSRMFGTGMNTSCRQ